MIATGRVEPLGPYGLAEAFLSLLPIYWWYHVDKSEHGYRAGPLMNAGMVAATIVALPIYFVRSRGWKKGSIAILIAAVVVAVSLGLSELGEWIGGLLAW